MAESETVRLSRKQLVEMSLHRSSPVIDPHRQPDPDNSPPVDQQHTGSPADTQDTLKNVERGSAQRKNARPVRREKEIYTPVHLKKQHESDVSQPLGQHNESSRQSQKYQQRVNDFGNSGELRTEQSEQCSVGMQRENSDNRMTTSGPRASKYNSCDSNPRSSKTQISQSNVKIKNNVQDSNYSTSSASIQTRDLNKSQKNLTDSSSRNSPDIPSSSCKMQDDLIGSQTELSYVKDDSKLKTSQTHRTNKKPDRQIYVPKPRMSMPRPESDAIMQTETNSTKDVPKLRADSSLCRDKNRSAVTPSPSDISQRNTPERSLIESCDRQRDSRNVYDNDCNNKTETNRASRSNENRKDCRPNNENHKSSVEGELERKYGGRKDRNRSTKSMESDRPPSSSGLSQGVIEKGDFFDRRTGSTDNLTMARASPVDNRNNSAPKSKTDQQGTNYGNDSKASENRKQHGNKDEDLYSDQKNEKFSAKSGRRKKNKRSSKVLNEKLISADVESKVTTLLNTSASDEIELEWDGTADLEIDRAYLHSPAVCLEWQNGDDDLWPTEGERILMEEDADDWSDVGEVEVGGQGGAMEIGSTRGRHKNKKKNRKKQVNKQESSHNDENVEKGKGDCPSIVVPDSSAVEDPIVEIEQLKLHAEEEEAVSGDVSGDVSSKKDEEYCRKNFKSLTFVNSNIRGGTKNASNEREDRSKGRCHVNKENQYTGDQADDMCDDSKTEFHRNSRLSGQVKSSRGATFKTTPGKVSSFRGGASVRGVGGRGMSSRGRPSRQSEAFISAQQTAKIDRMLEQNSQPFQRKTRPRDDHRRGGDRDHDDARFEQGSKKHLSWADQCELEDERSSVKEGTPSGRIRYPESTRTNESNQSESSNAHARSLESEMDRSRLDDRRSTNPGKERRANVGDSYMAGQAQGSRPPTHRTLWDPSQPIPVKSAAATSSARLSPSSQANSFVNAMERRGMPYDFDGTQQRGSFGSGRSYAESQYGRNGNTSVKDFPPLLKSEESERRKFGDGSGRNVSDGRSSSGSSFYEGPPQPYFHSAYGPQTPPFVGAPGGRQMNFANVPYYIGPEEFDPYYNW